MFWHARRGGCYSEGPLHAAGGLTNSTEAPTVPGGPLSLGTVVDDHSAISAASELTGRRRSSYHS